MSERCYEELVRKRIPLRNLLIITYDVTKGMFSYVIQYRTAFILDVVNVVIAVLVYIFLGKSILYQEGLSVYGDVSPLAFIISGLALDIIARQVYSISAYVKVDDFEFVLHSPMPLFHQALLNNFYKVVADLGKFSIYLAVAYVFGVRFKVNVVAALAMAVVLIMFYIGVGLVASGVNLIIKKGDPVNWFLYTITDLLSGKLFPVGILPPVFQGLSWVLPTTWFYLIWRLSTLNNMGLFDITPSGQPVWLIILCLGVFSLVLIAIGKKTLDYGIEKCLREGVLP